MKKLYFLLLFTSFAFSQENAPHCGLDFTTYLVVNPVFNGKVVPNLKITLVNADLETVINTDNKYSFTDNNQVLQFIQNKNSNDKNFKDQYIIQMNKTFDPISSGFQVKIEDENGVYKTAFYPIDNSNLYVICSSEIRKFGKKMTNNAINVPLNLN